MFNVTILKMKDIVKSFLGIAITILIVVTISKTFSKKEQEKQILNGIKNEISSLSERTLISSIDKTIPIISNVNQEYRNISNEKDVSEEENNFKEILKTQMSFIKSVEQESEDKKIAKEENNTNENENSNTSLNNNETTKEEQNLQMANIGEKTEVVTNNPISENYNVEYGSVKIKNQTKYELTKEMLTPDITIENKNIVLFHTHSCESYTSSEKYPYTPTGTFRTTDLNFSVVRVGDELENYLKQYGYNVVHSREYHDYPSYNGSYTRSLATVENILKTTPSDIIFDVHRDAVRV